MDYTVGGGLLGNGTVRVTMDLRVVWWRFGS